MRELCEKCGVRRKLKLVILWNREDRKIKVHLCRPCHSAIKAASRERVQAA